MEPEAMALPPPPTQGFRPQTMSEAHEAAVKQAQIDEMDEPVTPEELAEYAEFLGMDPGEAH